jgi:hypothetical protein
MQPEMTDTYILFHVSCRKEFKARLKTYFRIAQFYRTGVVNVICIYFKFMINQYNGI